MSKETLNVGQTYTAQTEYIIPPTSNQIMSKSNEKEKVPYYEAYPQSLQVKKTSKDELHARIQIIESELNALKHALINRDVEENQKQGQALRDQFEQIINPIFLGKIRGKDYSYLPVQHMWIAFNSYYGVQT